MMVASDRECAPDDLRDLADFERVMLTFVTSPVLLASFSASSSSDMIACGLPNAGMYPRLIVKPTLNNT